MTWDDFFIAAIGGVAATGLWTLLMEGRRRLHLMREFGPLAGDYSVRRKNSEPDEVEPETLSIKVTGSILRVQMDDFAEAWTATGEIAMNEQFPRSGHGQYVQTLRTDEVLWGAWDIQRMDADTILAETTYSSHVQFAPVVVAYIWERVSQ